MKCRFTARLNAFIGIAVNIGDLANSILREAHVHHTNAIKSIKRDKRFKEENRRKRLHTHEVWIEAAEAEMIRRFLNAA